MPFMMWNIDHQTIIRVIRGQFKERQKQEKIFIFIQYTVMKTLWVCILIGLCEGNKGKVVQSKHFGYLSCELKLNGYFEWSGADRLG